MNALEVFTYSDQTVRTVIVNDEPWFVAADVCAVLGIGNARQAVSYLDEDEVSQVESTVISNDGGPARHIINEPGLYSLILRSRKPEAKAFKRWITHEVLPAIRRTGAYSTAPAIPQTYAQALQLAADQAAQLEAQAAQLAVVAPKAESWDVLASADGDFSVGDAAKVLSRDPNIRVGQQRLFGYLGEIGWLFRQRGDRRWRVYQFAVESGWLSELPSSHYHPRTGQLVLDPPQVRVTTRGLHELHRRLAGVPELAITS